MRIQLPKFLSNFAKGSSSAPQNIQGDHSGNNGSHNQTNSHNTTNTTNHTYLNQNGADRREDHTRALQLLYKSGPKYRSHRNRVPAPVSGTCTWVTEHQTYKEWLEKKSSGLLWLSADPGCGKSVIASFLVSHLEDRNNTIVCYFFFNDDNPEQRKATSALCAILHQLFEKRSSLCIFAAEALNSRGEEFTEEVDTLWDILVKAVVKERCGDVICVVDALDECEDRTRSQLVRLINDLPESQTPDAPLKFLVTSRPYHKIEKELDSQEATMRLRGEDEVGAITNDVTRVIDDGIRELESLWKPKKLGYLRNLLQNSADRTFLWVSLVIAILKDSDDSSQEAFTSIVSTAPRNLAEFYTKMLDKSTDQEKARKILHIVVGAARPLTIQEMNVAFRLAQDYKTLQDPQDLDYGFERTVKSLCGLFVRIIDSQIYLVHQTAREFLIKGKVPGLGKWQHTLGPMDSSFKLAQICTTYLSLENFENVSAISSSSTGTGGAADNCAPECILLDYAACYWARHLRDSPDRQIELFDLTQQICAFKSNTFLKWLEVYWKHTGQCDPPPNDFTHLMIASWLGQHRIVKKLLKNGGDINARSKNYGTALNIAALRKDVYVTRALLRRSGKAYIGGKKYNILNMKGNELEELEGRDLEMLEFLKAVSSDLLLSPSCRLLATIRRIRIPCRARALELLTLAD